MEVRSGATVVSLHERYATIMYGTAKCWQGVRNGISIKFTEMRGDETKVSGYPFSVSRIGNAGMDDGIGEI